MMDNVVYELVDWLKDEHDKLDHALSSYNAPSGYKRGYNEALIRVINYIESRDDYRPAMRLTDNGKAACSTESTE